ncbi:hypothetical protein JWJ90_07620 [Desulfobulbus rhabdoformis]|nr:hypothetical protein [Desulfobulbus rhabdoformis]
MVNPGLLELLGLFSLVTFVGSLLVVPWVIGRMPADYFVNHWRQVDQSHTRHPVVALVSFVLRNVFGFLLFLAGFAMLFLPGQGLLTMLIGVCLLNFPGKRTLLNKIVQNPSVQRGLNWIRRKQGKELFLFVVAIDRGR